MTKSLSIDSSRPSLPYFSKSFTRYEPAKPGSPSRNRASSLRNGVVPDALEPQEPKVGQGRERESKHEEDFFEKRNSEEDRRETKTVTSNTVVEELPKGFDELPIELISLTDR